MNSTKNIVAASVFTAVLSFATAMAVEAAEVLTMRPLQAVSFEVEAKRAVGYYLNEEGICKLVVTLADPPDADDATRFVVTRFEAAVKAGKTTRFAVTSGRSLDFTCQPDAQAMLVVGLERIASSPPVR